MTTDTWDRSTVPPLADAMLGRLEGCKLAAHWDPLSKRYDIGYGSLHMPNGALVKAGDTLTQVQANALLNAQCAVWVRDIAGSIRWSLNVFQAAALIAFAHNVGGGAFDADSKFVAMANAGRLDLCFGQMIGWSHSGGKLVLGLMHRNEYQRQIAMGEAVDSLAAYSKVWAIPEAALMTLYNGAYAQASAWGHASAGPVVTGPAIVASTIPRPLPTAPPIAATLHAGSSPLPAHPALTKPAAKASAPSEADALNDAQLAFIKGA